MSCTTTITNDPELLDIWKKSITGKGKDQWTTDVNLRVSFYGSGFEFQIYKAEKVANQKEIVERCFIALPNENAKVVAQYILKDCKENN